MVTAFRKRHNGAPYAKILEISKGFAPIKVSGIENIVGISTKHSRVPASTMMLKFDIPE
jgi:hypothetical protein